MIDRGKRNILGVLVDAVDYEAAVERIIRAATERQPMAATALAVHGVTTGAQDAAHRYRLNHFDLVCPDGQPVRWALNLLYGTSLPDRVYGPTLTLLLCERAAALQLPVFLFGSRMPVLEALSQNLRARFPGLRIAGVQPSRFRRLSEMERDEVVEKIRSSGAALTLVGLGCPRQEVWVYEHRELLEMPLVAVGAAFDFHAGLLRQAPPVVQRAGLEWLFRMAMEPRRLWRRYLYSNSAYLGLLALQFTGLRRFDPRLGSPPSHPVSYG
jgi:N-acetylglucosaminyldiphosphoundecaprenol N-acetyl-beta-D-mannosaminyltransferase